MVLYFIGVGFVLWYISVGVISFGENKSVFFSKVKWFKYIYVVEDGVKIVYVGFDDFF